MGSWPRDGGALQAGCIQASRVAKQPADETQPQDLVSREWGLDASRPQAETAGAGMSRDARRLAEGSQSA